MGQATLARPPAIPLIPSDAGNSRATLARFAVSLNQALRGTIAATMGVTLVADDTSSTFSDSRIGPYTSITLMPQTGHAADVLPSCWVETTKGSVTIHHASVTYTDMQFVICLIG